MADSPQHERTGPAATTLQKLLLVAFGLGLIAAFVLLLEVGLRLAGLGEAHLYEDPFVGFSGQRDLFVKTVDEDGLEVFATSPEKLAFFNLQTFPADKDPETYRIFALGGSTTAGRPYDAELAFPAWLERYLGLLEPSRRFEVVNAGGISYASYRVALVMQELVRYQPDLLIVYTGHNEFLEERTYSDLIHQSPWLRKLRLGLDGLRSYTVARQVTREAIRRLGVGGDDMPSTLDADVETRLDSWRGLELYRRDDELRESILAHFDNNLRRMAAIAESADVDLLLIKPASNIKDFSPFKSEHRADIEPDGARRIARLLQAAGDNLERGQTREALRQAQSAVEADPAHADSQFVLGRALLAAGRLGAARDGLVLAKDLDVAPLRALEEQVEIVAAVARARGLPLVDLPQVLEDQSLGDLGHRILGDEYFLDHVHPDTLVHSLLAELIIDQLGELGIVSPPASGQQAARSQIFEDVLGSKDDAYYARRDLNLAKVLGWSGKLAESEAPLRRAAAVLTDEPEVFLNLGIMLQRTGRPGEASRALLRSIELDPASAAAWFNLGVVHAATDKLPEAVDAFKQALARKPRYAEAHFNLGIVLGRLGRWQEAIPELQRSLELRGETAEIHRQLALAYRRVGREESARESLAKALELDPGSLEEVSERGFALLREGKAREARDTFRQLLELSPEDAEAHFGLGASSSSTGDLALALESYERAIALDPRHAQAMNNLGILLARGGRLADGREMLERAVTVDPGYADAHFNLAITQDASGEPLLAIGSVERALELDPENERFQQALALLRAAHGDAAPARGPSEPRG